MDTKIGKLVERLNRLANDHGSDWPYRLPLREALSEAASTLTQQQEEIERLREEQDDLQGVVDELVDRIQKGPALSPVPEPTEVKR